MEISSKFEIHVENLFTKELKEMLLIGIVHPC